MYTGNIEMLFLIQPCIYANMHRVYILLYVYGQYRKNIDILSIYKPMDNKHGW